MKYADVQVFTGARGHPCASIGGLNLHSQIDPVREAGKVAETPENAAADAVVLFGLGLGYVFEALVKKNSERPVIVVESDAGWPQRAIAIRNEAGFPLNMTAPVQLILSERPDDLVLALQDVGSRNPVMVVNPALRKLYPDDVRAFELSLKKYRERFQVNINTLKKFGRLWVRNLARNLDTLAESGAVASFENEFSGLPGLLIAGGPSLDAVGPYLDQLQQRCIIVAVDTSLRACLAVGVDPDFVVTIDPQYWNTRHLDSCQKSRAKVVSESSILPRSLRQTQGPIYFCSSLFPLGQYFESLAEEKGKLGAGGSVATTAWDFLRYAGVRDIWIAGLDLSFPNGQTHFKGSIFEEATHRDSTRIQPASMRRYDYLYGAGTYPVTNGVGEQVLTDKRMDIYAHWFEAQARLHPEVRNWRLGRGSRVLDGFTELDLNEALKLPPIRAEIDLRTHQIAKRDSTKNRNIEELRKNVSEGRTALCQELKTLMELSQSAIFHVESAISLASNPDADSILSTHLQKLDGIDQVILHSDQLRIVGFLVEELIQEISITVTPGTLVEALLLSKRLYGAMQQAAIYHLQLFSK